jgi:L-rhamnose mutarotase
MQQKQQLKLLINFLEMKYKRYCKTMLLNNDPEQIREYRQTHRIGAAWPEVTRGAKEIGIIDLEIYIFGNRLFMIMDTVPDFDHEKAMLDLSLKPRQQEWETFVSRFQKVSPEATSMEKWQLMERVFEMEQTAEYAPEEGQLKEKK